jgi:hypothetical protein
MNGFDKRENGNQNDTPGQRKPRPGGSDRGLLPSVSSRAASHVAYPNRTLSGNQSYWRTWGFPQEVTVVS